MRIAELIDLEEASKDHEFALETVSLSNTLMSDAEMRCLIAFEGLSGFQCA